MVKVGSMCMMGTLARTLKFLMKWMADGENGVCDEKKIRFSVES